MRGIFRPKKFTPRPDFGLFERGPGAVRNAVSGPLLSFSKINARGNSGECSRDVARFRVYLGTSGGNRDPNPRRCNRPLPGRKTDRSPSLIASEPLFSLAGATQVLTEALATYNLPTIYSTIFAQFAAAAALNVSYSMPCDPSDLSEIARITTNGVLFR